MEFPENLLDKGNLEFPSFSIVCAEWCFRIYTIGCFGYAYFHGANRKMLQRLWIIFIDLCGNFPKRG